MLTDLGSSTYHESRLALGDEPLAIVGRLARLAGASPYAVYERAGEYCFAAGVLAEARISAERVHLALGTRTRQFATPPDPLDAVVMFAEQVPVSGWRMYGWAAFELALLLAHQEVEGPDTDLMHLSVPRIEVRLSQGEGLIRATDPREIEALRALITAAGPTTPAEPTSPPAIPVAVEDTGNYRAAVGEAVRRIRSGELEKVILSRTVAVPGEVDLIATYLHGRPTHTPARSFLLDVGRMRATGFSPEIVVEVRPDGSVRAQPLAGTRARHRSSAVNSRLGAQLQSNPKEVYEHAISVRAVWQELSGLPESRDVRIDRYMTVSQRGSVQHLASSLRCTLPDGGCARSWSAFAALFPSVTATGVPKPAAYSLIRDLEPRPRGLYAGAVLIHDQDGALDAALVLRTVFQDASGSWLQAGAGIVGQSTAEREHEETCEKLRGVADILVTRDGTHGRQQAFDW